MKKLNKNGFTLIELLAVIVVMGILMFVAIPAVSRTIENSRKDTFRDTAKQYVNQVKTLWASDGLKCGGTLSSAVGAGTYYVEINSANNWLLDQGGNSSWGNKPVTGYVRILVEAETDGRMTSSYYVSMTDGTHGINDDVSNPVKSDLLEREHVIVLPSLSAPSGTKCVPTA